VKAIIGNLISGLTILSVCLEGQTNASQPPAAEIATKSLPDRSELVTDRPDFTESTQVVGTGVFQFENGFTVGREHGVRSLTGPETLIRIGLSKRLELRLGGAGYLSERTGESDKIRGLTDFELGVKIHVFEQSRFRPALSIIPLISMPTGGANFSSRGYDPTVKLALEKDLMRGFTLGGNLNLSSFQTPEGRFRQTAFSASLGHELGAGFGAYWEVFGFSPWEKGGAAAVIVNTGISHGIGKRAQVDVRVGRRITEAGPDWFFGMGMAIREPTQIFVH
jgi:hypothetical protein